MSRGRILLLSLAVAALAVPCLADEDDWPVLKGARVENRPPAVAYAVYRSLGHRSTGFGVYRMQRPDALKPYLLARRVEAQSGKAEIAWASSETCPQLEPALAELARLPAPVIAPPRTSPAGELKLTLDGSSYFLWATDARWSAADSAAGMELRAVDHSPVAAWSEKTLKSLEPCWGPTRP